MTLPSAPRAQWWGFAAGAAAVVLCVGIWLVATASFRRQALTRSAGAVAGYLSAGVRRERDGTYHLPTLVSTAHTLDRGIGWSDRVQVFLGRVPILPSATDSLPEDVRRRLVSSDGPTFHRNAAVAPLKDPSDWDVVGAVTVAAERTPVRNPAAWGWVAALAALGLLTAYVSAHTGRQRVAWGSALVLVLGGHLLIRDAARTATDAWLLDAQALVEQAAWSRSPDFSELARITRVAGATVRLSVVPPEPTRMDMDGVPRAVVGVLLPTREMAAVAIPPDEARLEWWTLLLVLAAVIGPAGVALARWYDRARQRPAYLRETLTAWGFLAPAAVLLAVFSLAPILFAGYLSLHHWTPLEPVKPFAGVSNYLAVFGDGQFWRSLANTAIYSLYVPVSAALALVVALLVNRRVHGIRLVRTIFFVPFVSSVVAVGLVWQWMYHPDYGLINHALTQIGWRPLDWLGNPRTALIALMILSVWVHLGYQMVVFLAGLQGIPETYLEAARVDGANAWQRFRHVRLPLLRPVILFVLATGMIGAFQVFTLVYVMTGGGPLQATDVAVYRIYQTAWESLQFGTASTMSLVLFVVLLAVTLIQFRLLGRRVEYA
jgi:multiple sugar transport system permease protein